MVRALEAGIGGFGNESSSEYRASDLIILAVDAYAWCCNCGVKL
jgi:hypothetical protein